MKRTLIITVCLLLLLLMCGCEAEEGKVMPTVNTDFKTVTFVNGPAEADLWLLAETEANRKTTLWGTPTASKLSAGESRSVPLGEPGDGGLYMLRMIDADSFYYSADGIEAEDGWTLRLTQDGDYAVTLEVTDKNGDLKNTYEVFSARL